MIFSLQISKWKYESFQLKDKNDKIERRKYLLDFRIKLLTYKNGEKVEFPPRIYTEEQRNEIKYNI